MTTDPAVLLLDVLRAAADDVGIDLLPHAENQLLDRALELLELLGYDLAVEPTEPPRKRPRIW